MAIVDQFKIGNTRIIIDDSYCVSREESEKIRQRAEKMVNHWIREGTYKID